MWESFRSADKKVIFGSVAPNSTPLKSGGIIDAAMKEVSIFKNFDSNKIAIKVPYLSEKTKTIDVKNLLKYEMNRLWEGMRLIEVSNNNINEIKAKITEIFKNHPERPDKNIDLQIGDKFIWNTQNQQMDIIDRNKHTKFRIRFMAETSIETRENENLAKI